MLNHTWGQALHKTLPSFAVNDRCTNAEVPCLAQIGCIGGGRYVPKLQQRKPQRPVYMLTGEGVAHAVSCLVYFDQITTCVVGYWTLCTLRDALVAGASSCSCHEECMGSLVVGLISGCAATRALVARGTLSARSQHHWGKLKSPIIVSPTTTGELDSRRELWAKRSRTVPQ